MKKEFLPPPISSMKDTFVAPGNNHLSGFEVNSGAIKLLWNKACKIAHQLLPNPDFDISVVLIDSNSITPV
jgi:hypothetical protein